MLNKVISEHWLKARAVIGFLPPTAAAMTTLRFMWMIVGNSN